MHIERPCLLCYNPQAKKYMLTDESDGYLFECPSCGNYKVMQSLYEIRKAFKDELDCKRHLTAYVRTNNEEGYETVELNINNYHMPDPCNREIKYPGFMKKVKDQKQR